jgi:hypothetical protein
MDEEPWIAQGFRVIKEEVFKQGWPENSKLWALVEVAFYGGATWIMHVLADEGVSPETIERIREELRAHSDEVRGRVKERS